MLELSRESLRSENCILSNALGLLLLFSALETFVIIALYKSTFTIPYHITVSVWAVNVIGCLCHSFFLLYLYRFGQECYCYSYFCFLCSAAAGFEITHARVTNIFGTANFVAVGAMGRQVTAS